MKLFMKIVAMVFFGLIHVFANAGSPDGLYLLVRPTQNSVGYSDNVKYFFDTYSDHKINFDCDDKFLNIEIAYLKNPKSINKTLNIEPLAKGIKSKNSHRHGRFQ